jgi:hypothetical protein
VDKKFFECLRCGHYTPFAAGTRPRCGYCGGMTGLVENDTETPMFRFSRKNPGLPGLPRPKLDD